MPVSKSKHLSRVYQKFKDIDASEYQSIIYFFEEYEAEINRLALDLNFEMLIAYVQALFETGNYRKHYQVVDQAIEASILNNIQFHKGEDIFQKLLFQKAAACYHTLRYAEAEHILEELIKINPYNKIYQAFLKKCLRRQLPDYVRNSRALSVLLFLFAALTISFEVLYVVNFLPERLQAVQLLRNSLFLAGWLVLIGGDLTHRVRVNLEVSRFIQQEVQK